MRLIKYYKPESIKIFQSLGHDLVVAYMLKQAVLEFGDGKQIRFCHSQFLILKDCLEVLSRFHAITKFESTPDDRQKISKALETL